VSTSKRRNTLGRQGTEPPGRAARAAALDALARRDYSIEELRRKLLEKGYDATVVAPLLEALCAEKLLDDRRFTENFVAYHAVRGQGPLRIGADLSRQGLPGSLVEECLEGYPDWIVHLRKARAKKFGAGLPTHYADKQRQAKFLGYRGFTSAQIRMALGFDIDLDAD